MSALINTSSAGLRESAAMQQTLPIALFEAESLLRNIEPNNLVQPLRQARNAIAQSSAMGKETASQLRNAVLLQDQWEAWQTERELLRNDTRRGRECLEGVRAELAQLRSQLADWADYERICGKNPLSTLMQAIIEKERIEQFLPAWIENREKQLAALGCKMASCAQENGLEHLL